MKEIARPIWMITLDASFCNWDGIKQTLSSGIMTHDFGGDNRSSNLNRHETEMMALGIEKPWIKRAW